MNNPSVYVLSDSAGETAELVIKAGLSQYTNQNYKIQRVPYVDNKAIIDETLELVQEDSALIGFTLVDAELRNYMNQRANELDGEVIDIMGHMMKSMEKVFSNEPRLEARLINTLDKDYSKQIETIELAVRYVDA